MKERGFDGMVGMELVLVEWFLFFGKKNRVPSLFYLFGSGRGEVAELGRYIYEGEVN